MEEIDFKRIERINEIFELLEVRDPNIFQIDGKVILDKSEAPLMAARAFNYHSQRIPETFSIYDLQDYTISLHQSIQENEDTPNDYERQVRRDGMYFGNKDTIFRRSHRNMRLVLQEMDVIDNLEDFVKRISKNAVPKINDTVIRNTRYINSLYHFLDKEYSLEDVLELRRQFVLRNTAKDKPRYYNDGKQLEFNFEYNQE